MKFLNVKSMSNIKNEIDQFTKSKTIEIDTDNALNFTLCEDVYSKINVPNFNKSCVDGYAIIHTDSNGASESSPIMFSQIESLSIGIHNKMNLNSCQCQYVVTGGMVPVNCSGVVKIEDCESFGDKILVKKDISKNEALILSGEEFQKEQLVFEKGHQLSNRDIALLLSLGISTVNVYKNLTCVVISSGNELVNYKNDLHIGQTYDVNTFLLSSELKSLGINVIDTVVLKDDYELYKNTLNAYDVDIYITSGGSSKGNEDYTLKVFDELTQNVICHGISTKPGKPTILAKTREKLYLGLPGNPVSAYLVMYQLLHNCKTITMKVSENVNSDPGKTSAILVQIENGIATPIYYRSSYLKSLAIADGFFVISENLEGVNALEEVEVTLFE